MRKAVAAVAVLLVSAIPSPAHAATLPVEHNCQNHNGSLNEASGLAMSRKFPKIAYTLNDTVGQHPVVYAIYVQDCTLKGVYEVNAPNFPDTISDIDTEAISVSSNGTIWIADTGDNTGARHDVSLFSFPEPSKLTGANTTTTIERYSRYFVSYDGGGHVDVESLLVPPNGGLPSLVSKTALGTNGAVYGFKAPLQASSSSSCKSTADPQDSECVFNVAYKTSRSVPGGVSDATYTPDSRYVLIRRKDDQISAFRTSSWPWPYVSTWATPDLMQPESLTVSLLAPLHSKTVDVWVGSEGSPSPFQELSVPLS